MTETLTLDARILQELGEIKAGQTHMQNDIADIKTEIKEIRAQNDSIEERVRVLETTQAECRGRNTTASSAFNKLTALVSGAVSAGVALLVALITAGKI